ncbi:hypothetical protein BC829DRAFT_422804 [Chytridium lagenaria]|nr:hypothetical protein BC829DRAFT_422804 [Chytridium lagenaria]
MSGAELPPPVYSAVSAEPSVPDPTPEPLPPTSEPPGVYLPAVDLIVRHATDPSIIYGSLAGVAYASNLGEVRRRICNVDRLEYAPGRVVRDFAFIVIGEPANIPISRAQEASHTVTQYLSRLGTSSEKKQQVTIYILPPSPVASTFASSSTATFVDNEELKELKRKLFSVEKELNGGRKSDVEMADVTRIF